MKFPLSGTDCFLLALHRHIEKNLGDNFVCYFSLDLDRSIDLALFSERVNNNPYVRALNSVYVKENGFLGAAWVLEKNHEAIPVSIRSWEELPEGKSFRDLFRRNYELHKPAMLGFDIVNTDKGCRLFLSWHHLLMDGYGARLLLQSINSGESGFKPENFFVSKKRESFLSRWKNLLFTKNRLQEISDPPLAKIPADKTIPNTVKDFSISLDEEEESLLRYKMKQQNWIFFESAYALGCAAYCYAQMLSQKKILEGDLWIPVPVETRKKGSEGPYLGNHYTFMFYRLSPEVLKNREATIREVVKQFKDQMKIALPTKYLSMMELLRLIPSALYYQLIKGPHGESLASALFSYSPEPVGLSPFMGIAVSGAWAYPPDTTPPGISFQFMKFAGKSRVLIQYNERCFNEMEINILSQNLKLCLLQ